MKTSAIILIIACAALLTGCSMLPGNYSTPSTFVISRTSVPVVLDGKADDAVWKTTPAYPFILPGNRLTGFFNNVPVQKALVQMAYDDTYLYVLADFEDDDIVSFGANDTHLYVRGDVLEIFVRHPNTRHYWEIYGAPNGATASLFYRSAGSRIFPEATQLNHGIKCAATLNGTINKHDDKDQGFLVEMAIPLAHFKAQGDTFGPGEKWTVFCARYNYSSFQDICENSCTSNESRLNYHDIDVYVPAEFGK